MTLADYITQHLGIPFEWGTNDCCLFSFGWLEHATGIDYLAPYKPWSSAREAIRKVDDAGGLELFLDSHRQRINPHLAVDGDIAVVNRTAFLFSGPHIVSVGEDGLVFLNRMEAKCAWHF